MASITGYTAARMKAIEDASVVGGEVDSNGDLILERFDESTINAGHVHGQDAAPAIVSAEVVGDNLILTREDNTTVNAGNVRGPIGLPGESAPPVGYFVARRTSAVSLSDGVETKIAFTSTRHKVPGHPGLNEGTTSEPEDIGYMAAAGQAILVWATGLWQFQLYSGAVKSGNGIVNLDLTAKIDDSIFDMSHRAMTFTSGDSFDTLNWNLTAYLEAGSYIEFYAKKTGTPPVSLWATHLQGIGPIGASNYTIENPYI